MKKYRLFRPAAVCAVLLAASIAVEGCASTSAGEEATLLAAQEREAAAASADSPETETADSSESSKNRDTVENDSSAAEEAESSSDSAKDEETKDNSSSDSKEDSDNSSSGNKDSASQHSQFYRQRKSYSYGMKYKKDTTVSGESFTSDEDSHVVVMSSKGTLNLNDTAIRFSGDNSIGLIAFNKGKISASGVSVSASGETDSALRACDGGQLDAVNCTAKTTGTYSPVIYCNPGSTMSLDGGTFDAEGEHSSAVISSADLTLHASTLSSYAAELITLYRDGQIKLYDCSLTGEWSKEKDDIRNILLTNSSTDAAPETGSQFLMSGGTLSAAGGGLFRVTNTTANILMENVTVQSPSADTAYFLRCTGNDGTGGLGKKGSNGAVCNFTGITQDVFGNIVWDSISDLDFYMTEGSTLTGAFRQDDTNAGKGGKGYARLVVDASSAWVVTADSTLTTLEVEGTVTDAEGQTVQIVGTDGTVYQEGTSDLKVTVENYSDTADVSEAQESSSWENAE